MKTKITRKQSVLSACRFLLSALLLLAFAGSAGAAQIFKDVTTTDMNTVANWSTTSGASTPDPASIGTSDALRFNEYFATTSGTLYLASMSGSLTCGGIKLDSGSGSGGSATGNLLIDGGGNTLTLNGAVAGDIQYAGGGIVLNSATGGWLIVSNCPITIGAAGVQFVTSRALTNYGAISLGANTLSFNTAGSVANLVGAIGGTGGISKTAGAGNLLLSGTASSFSGQVTAVGGTLSVAKLATIGNNSSIGTGSTASSIILNGSVLTYVGTGGDTTDRAIDMRASAVINNNGAGTIAFTAANVTQSLAASARTLTLGGTYFGGANTFSCILTNSGTGANISTLQKSGASIWTVTGVHAYSGSTTINQGTLRVTGSGVLGGATGSVVDAGNIWFTSANANGTVEFETAANLGPADQIRFRNTGGTAGNGGNLKYIGTTSQTVSKTLQCDSSIGMRLESDSVGGAITFNGGFSQVNRSLYLGGTGSGDNSFAMVFSGSGTLTKRGAGTWIVSNTQTYTGATVVNDGRLLVNGSLAVGSAVSVASGATLGGTGTISGTLTVAAGGTVAPGASIGTLTVGSTPSLGGSLLMEVNRNGGSPLADNINFTGSVTFGGTLTLTNVGATLQNGDTFNLFDGTLGGSFSTLNLPDGANHWNTSDLNGGGTITYTNASPVAKNLTAGVVHGGTVTVPVIGGKNSAADADGDSLTVTAVSTPSSGSASFGASNITYVASGITGTNTFTYTVADALGATDTKTVTVVVTDPQGFNQVSAGVDGGNAVLQYLGIPGTNYVLEITHELPATNWFPVLTNTAGANGYLNFTNPISLTPTNDYYRTRYAP